MHSFVYSTLYTLLAPYLQLSPTNVHHSCALKSQFIQWTSIGGGEVSQLKNYKGGEKYCKSQLI